MRDVETGLDYFKARYYSSAQGRFTSADPENAGANMADPQTWSGYAYVNNNPLNYTDPTGEGIFSWIGSIVGGFFGGPLGAMIGWGAGTAGEAALWGPSANAKIGGVPTIGSIAGCGGPLGNCGGLGNAPWNEDLLGPAVQDPGRFIFSFEDQYKNGRRLLPNGDVAIYGLWVVLTHHSVGPVGLLAR